MKRLVLAAFVLICLTGCSPREKSWLALGDSITYLNDHLDETGHRVTKGYLTNVASALPHIHYVNKGYNGWTAGDVAQRIDTLGLTRADIYTVFLGTNDWWRGRAVGSIEDYTGNSGNETFFGSFRIIIDHLKALNPESRIILLTPMQRVDFVYLGNFRNNAYGSYRAKDGQTLADFADAIIAIGQVEKLKVIDLYNDSGMKHENLVKFKRLKDPATGVYKQYQYPEYVDVPFDPATDEYPYPPDAIDMTYDGLHPSDKGYQVIANLLVQELD
jgi:lysophospholipase L1-like esterase